MLTIIFVCLGLCFIGYIVNEEITFLEFLGNCLISILISLFLFGIMLIPFPNDSYYKSGKLIRVEHHPYFVEEYEDCWETCTEDDDGNETCETHCSTEHAKHNEYWLAKDSLGQEKEISKEFYDKVRIDFGNDLNRYYHGDDTRCTHGGYRIKGDNSLYYVNNATNTYEYPTSSKGTWHNPIKRSKSIFNTEKNVLEYPAWHNWFSNDRSPILKKEWDIMNTQIYEQTDANVILVVSKEDLKNFWMRGKKNDVIIQVDDLNNPNIVKVFGWYNSEILSANLSTIILEHGINKASLPLIKACILQYYQPFDFKEFDYLKYQLADWQIVVISIISIVVMLFSYIAFSTNEYRR